MLTRKRERQKRRRLQYPKKVQHNINVKCKQGNKKLAVHFIYL